MNEYKFTIGLPSKVARMLLDRMLLDVELGVREYIHLFFE
jgi:hypothetical protein